MSTNDGGNAFPLAIRNDTDVTWVDGLSKLEWFAGMAMQGELSAQAGNEIFWSDACSLAVRSFNVAAFMLAESERRNSKP